MKPAPKLPPWWVIALGVLIAVVIALLWVVARR
jgi:hypothetical protein